MKEEQGKTGHPVQREVEPTADSNAEILKNLRLFSVLQEAAMVSSLPHIQNSEEEETFEF